VKSPATIGLPVLSVRACFPYYQFQQVLVVRTMARRSAPGCEMSVPNPSVGISEPRFGTLGEPPAVATTSAHPGDLDSYCSTSDACPGPQSCIRRSHTLNGSSPYLVYKPG
jgi:hypothetical protein